MKTDWEAYYSRPFFAAHLTRRITGKITVSMLKRHGAGKGISITEPGGGNSCFYELLDRTFAPVRYKVIDTSETGCRLFQSKAGEGASAEPGDILDEPKGEESDLTLSFGLIEHFSPEKTARAIEHHFLLTKRGGLVLFTFPTPTLSYRLIRSVAEKLRLWKFPDERPLEDAEVLKAAEKYGILLEKRINNRILLSQEIILFRRR